MFKPRETITWLRSLAAGANLASLPLVRRPSLAVEYAMQCLFLKGCMADETMLPQRQVWDVLPRRGPHLAPIIDPPSAGEWFRTSASFTADLIALCMICRLIEPETIFEIGTLHGSGALHLALNAPKATVYTLDLPPAASSTLPTTTPDRWHIEEHARTLQPHFAFRPESARIVPLRGDSATFNYGAWRNEVDLFFIDGAHSYEYVRNDTMRALDCCHAGSVIAWHDYGRFGVNGVSRWLHDFARRGYNVYRVPGGSLAYMQLGAPARTHNTLAEPATEAA